MFSFTHKNRVTKGRKEKIKISSKRYKIQKLIFYMIFIPQKGSQYLQETTMMELICR